MHEWLNTFHKGAAFPLSEVAVKAAISISIGLLVGFEREWSNKEIGVRTFALTSLLGMLATLIGPPFGLLAGIAILILIGVLNLRNMQVARKLEATTSVALIIVFLLGALAGGGHLFTPVACSILVAMLLSLKPQFRALAGDLRQEEVRSAILLGLLGFVIWPLLPDRYVDPWNLLQPREAWITVILVASLGFLNYVLLRIYGSKGLYSTAILGGLVNSTATVAELSSSMAAAGLTAAIVPIALVTSVAMYMRNLAILAFFAPAAVRYAVLPVIAMMLLSLAWAYGGSRKPLAGDQEDVDLVLSSPVSLKKVLSFAGLFLLIQILGTLGQRFFGSSGLQTVSILGGLVSSASTSAAAASLARHGRVSLSQAGMAVILTSVASLLVDLPILYKEVADKRLLRELGTASGVQTAIGLAVFLLQQKFLRSLH